MRPDVEPLELTPTAVGLHLSCSAGDGSAGDGSAPWGHTTGPVLLPCMPASHVVLILSIEDHFGITLDPEMKLSDVGVLADEVQRLCAAKG